MDCEIKYIETTESTSIPYISVQLTCTTATTSYHQKMFLNNKYFQKNVPLRHLISPPRQIKSPDNSNILLMFNNKTYTDFRTA